MEKLNPFKPNSPVHSNMFAGRLSEIKELENGLYQTKKGYEKHFLVTGERGIGKSSLLMFIKHIAEGRSQSLEHGTFNFLPINLMISERTDLVTFIKLIEKSIKREIGKIESVKNFLADTWNFIQRIKIMDSGIERKEIENETDLLIDDFAYSLSETCKRITNPEKGETSKDGIIFIIDEADNACSELHIGYFFKIMTELLIQYECNNIMFVVAGLPDIVQKLSISHESSIRIFSQLKIRELNVEDRYTVIQRGIEQGNLINTEQTIINKDAIETISTLSEGYPNFIQQFAYSAFYYSNDNKITMDDVLDSALSDGGAIDAIGEKYYVSDYHSKIKTDAYREILKIMAEKNNQWMKKSEIRDKFSGNEHTVTDALSALTRRKIILKNPSKRGEYRLQQRGFALWIKLFGSRDINKYR